MKRRPTRDSNNPFVYDKPLNPADIIDRDPELEHLLKLARGGHYACLYAPRRYGKTSLLKKLLAQATDEHGMVCIFVDLSDVLTMAGLALRIERAYSELQGVVRRTVRELLAAITATLRLGPLAGSVTLATKPDPVASPEAALHQLLDLPVRVHKRTGKRTVCVFDEFQTVLNLEGADGLIRSHIQHHGEIAAYIFAGSEASLLRSLFEERVRPLYAQAEPIELGRLPAEPCVTYIAQRFRETGRDPGDILAPLVIQGAGHPQRTMLLAHRLWEEVPVGASADVAVWQTVLDRTVRQLDGEFRALWSLLTPNEQRVVEALAHGLGPFSKQALQSTGLKSVGSVQTAMKALIEKSVVMQEAGVYYLIDPLLPLWVQRLSV